MNWSEQNESIEMRGKMGKPTRKKTHSLTQERRMKYLTTTDH